MLGGAICREGPTPDVRLDRHPVKTRWRPPLICRTVRWVGLRAMVQERPVRVERKLSAILAADVAGYSRLMHNDEEATHAKLTALLADAVAPAIAEHGGRIVKNTGDGFLAEFPSAVQAVRAAAQFQSRINAIVEFERAIALDPNSVDAVANLGDAYIDLGQYKKA